jgi:hypothetical protein
METSYKSVFLYAMIDDLGLTQNAYFIQKKAKFVSQTARLCAVGEVAHQSMRKIGVFFAYSAQTSRL